MKKILILVSTIILSLSSCISLSEGAFNVPFERYQPTDFRYITSVYGEATESYILGIGGDYKGLGLHGGALNELKKKYKLSTNQTLINVTYDEKVTWFIIPLWIERKVIVTADVIEFYSEIEGYSDVKENRIMDNSNSIVEELLIEEEISSPDELLIQPEEEIIEDKKAPGLYYQGSRCRIIKEISDTEVKIKYLNQSGRAYYKRTVLKTEIVEIKQD